MNGKGKRDIQRRWCGHTRAPFYLIRMEKINKKRYGSAKENDRTVCYEIKRQASYLSKLIRSHTWIQNIETQVRTPMYTQNTHTYTCTERKTHMHIKIKKGARTKYWPKEAYIHLHTRSWNRETRSHNYTQDTFTLVLSPHAYKFPLSGRGTPGRNHVMQFL